MNYPTCEKLKAKSAERATVQEFLEFLNDKGIVFAIWRESGSQPHPWRGNPNDLLMEFLGIDPEKLEKERAALLKSCRKS